MQNGVCVRGPNHLILAVLTLAVGLGGCIQQRGDPRGSPRARGDDLLSVHRLAAGVGLRAMNVSASVAELRGGGNSVMLFADPGGTAYVNGRAMENPGRIAPVEGVLHVQKSLAPRIRAALGNGPAPAPDRNVPQRDSRPPPRNPRNGLGRVVIDPGHGGEDPGTDAAKQQFGIHLYEKEVNLSVSLDVARALKAAGARVYITRTKDQAVSLDRRVAIANRLKPNLFLSIHANYMPDKSLRGFEIIVAEGNVPRSRAAGRAIEKRLLSAGVRSYRGVRKDTRGLRVLKKTTCPAAIVEMSFLSNRADVELLRNAAWRRRVAQAIAEGVRDYLTAN